MPPSGGEAKEPWFSRGYLFKRASKKLVCTTSPPFKKRQTADKKTLGYRETNDYPKTHRTQISRRKLVERKYLVPSFVSRRGEGIWS